MLNPDGTLKILPKFEIVNGLTRTKFRDEHNKIYKSSWEYRWLNLPIEKSYGIEGQPVCIYYAFADTYHGLSQLNESRRQRSMEKYMGGVVGHKVSATQLQHLQLPTIFDILDQLREKGITTEYEYRLVERTHPTHPTMKDLIGKTKHTILNEQFIQSDDMETFQATIAKKPMYVSFQGSRPQMRIIARENTLFRRYASDEVDKSTFTRHAVLGTGYGCCVNEECPDDIVYYVVGQNNWPDGTAEICRFSYRSYNLGTTFDVGPLDI